MVFKIQFDYRFDNAGFFDSPQRRQLLEAAAQIWSAYIGDEFADIPTGETFKVPLSSLSGTFQPSVILNQPIDEILIFVYSLPLSSGSTTLASGGPFGSFIVGSDRDLRFNGSDFEPWLGTIYFNSSANFYFDSTPETDDVPADKIDFLSVAIHEIGHVLGIGASQAFNNQINGQQFAGAISTAINGGQPIPLSEDLGHIQEGYTIDPNSEALMDVSLSSGERTLPTQLDLALLADIGYQIAELDFPEEPPTLIPNINLSNNQTIVEGNTNPQSVTYTVSLSDSSTQIITVQYATSDGTAQAGLDYTSTAGTLTFSPGTTSQIVNIPILNDASNETDEIFSLTLTAPTNATLGTTTTATTNITDTLTASLSTTLPTNVENLTLTGADNINGTGNLGHNILSGNRGNNLLSGGEGNDTFYGGEGDDTLFGNQGDDTLSGEENNDVIYGGKNNDTLFGNGDNDTLFGDRGNDILYGGKDNDTIYGGKSNDTLFGDNGDDTLAGDRDNDTLTGGPGSDRYLFQSNQAFSTDLGVDYISDFEVGQDQIVLSKITFAAITNLAGEVLTDWEVVAEDSLVEASNAHLVFNQNTGSIFYNQNGSELGLGTGGEFARLGNPGIVLSGSDFSLV